MPNGKKAKPTSAMLSRMAGLESKLRSMFASRKSLHPHKAQVHKGKARSAGRPSGSPVGPGSRGGARGGALGLGSGVSGATTRRSQIISEDEYIGEILGSVAFSATSYSVNPGQSAVFPWGHQVAALYEEYEFTSLEFYYKREVSEFAVNGQAGKVLLSFNYDASDPVPTNKQEVEDTVPHVDGMPCTPVILLRVDCSRMRKNDSKYVRPGAQPVNTDIKTYDGGNLIVSTQGNTNTSVIGELRVRYTCKLSEPVLLSSSSSPVASYAHVMTSGSSTSSAPFSGATIASESLDITTTLPSTSTVLFSGLVDGAHYLLDYFVEANSLSVSPNLEIVSGGIYTNSLDNDTEGQITYADGGTGAGILSTILTTGTSLLLNLSGGEYSGGTVDLIIDSLGSLFSTRRLATHRGYAAHKAARALLAIPSCSAFSRLSDAQVDKMYAMLLKLGCINEDESPCIVGDDGVVRINDHHVGISTSAPPLSAAPLRLALRK